MLTGDSPKPPAKTAITPAALTGVRKATHANPGDRNRRKAPIKRFALIPPAASP